MNWKIKHFNELTVPELYSILKLRSEVFVVEQNCIYLDPDGKDHNSWHLFCENETGAVAACCRILGKEVSYKEFSIGRICSSLEYRNHGLGRELLKRSLVFITQVQKERAVRISAQSYLKDFYSSFGFLPVSDEYLEDDIPHIEMLYTSDEQ